MTQAELALALDECLNRMRRGRAIEACIAEYPHLSRPLAALLSTATSISEAPKALPSDDFRRLSRSRLLLRLREKNSNVKARKLSRDAAQPGLLVTILQRLTQVFNRPRLLAIPATLLLLITIGGSLSVIVNVGLPSTPTALASQCTLTILGGDVEFQTSGSNVWHDAANGVVLQAGVRLKTAPDSHALLTFFEGSSIKLEPGTDIEIQKLDQIGERSADIIIKQWIGTTWSRVVKRLDPGGSYEIHTPSAIALVRGTLFETEVDETARTTVKTREGVVTLRAQDEEVHLPAGLQSSVEYGASPSAPEPIPPSDNELVITVTMPAVASVSDPTGSSTGALPSGSFFNQITGARYIMPSDDIQIITLPEPMAGDYNLTLRCIADGAIRVSIEYLSKGEAVFSHSNTYALTDGSEWLIPLHLEMHDGQFASIAVGDIEPKGNRMPEKLVISEGFETPLPSVEPTGSPTQPIDNEITYALIVISSTHGSVTEPGQGVFFYPAGTEVTIIAKPDDGWRFDSWTGDVADKSSPTTNITITKSEVVTANFAPAK